MASGAHYQSAHEPTRRCGHSISASGFLSSYTAISKATRRHSSSTMLNAHRARPYPARQLSPVPAMVSNAETPQSAWIHTRSLLFREATLVQLATPLFQTSTLHGIVSFIRLARPIRPYLERLRLYQLALTTIVTLLATTPAPAGVPLLTSSVKVFFYSHGLFSF